MQYSYKIHRDIYQDAWNWWDSCNSINFGVDWSKKIDQEVVREIRGKSQEEAYKFLIPYLKEKYKLEKQQLDNDNDYIRKEMQLKFQPSCEKLAQAMGKTIYRNDFHFYLTTFPSIPYSKERGAIWLNYYWTSPDPILVFLHELCHLQFIHYWRENPKSSVSKLSHDDFENLKETLTIIIDKDFFPLVREEDKGYEIHQEFRQKLKNFWAKSKNFDGLVDFAINESSSPGLSKS